MAESLKLAHFIDQYRVPEMQVGCGWIKPGLDSQWAFRFEFFEQFRLQQNFFCATLEFRDLFSWDQCFVIVHGVS